MTAKAGDRIARTVSQVPARAVVPAVRRTARHHPRRAVERLPGRAGLRAPAATRCSGRGPASTLEGFTHFGALVIATLLSMLFGELVPKNAALARPMPLVRASAGPLRTFATMFSWLIRALNGSANFLVRRLGVEPQEELASARSPEELGLLAAISARAGAIPAETAVLLRRTIRFGEKRAAEAMTPRVDVVALRIDATVADLLAAARDTGHSRFPVFEDTLDHVTGVAGVTDALGVPPARRAIDVGRRGRVRNPFWCPKASTSTACSKR